jgi:hypothetical protein
MKAEYVIDTADETSKVTLKRSENGHEVEIKVVGQEDAIVFVKLRDLVDAAGGLAGEWWADFEKTVEELRIASEEGVSDDGEWAGNEPV